MVLKQWLRFHLESIGHLQPIHSDSNFNLNWRVILPQNQKCWVSSRRIGDQTNNQLQLCLAKKSATVLTFNLDFMQGVASDYLQAIGDTVE